MYKYGCKMREITPIRIQFNTVCKMLDMTRGSLRHLIQKDLTFPRPMKMGDSKQSPIFFDYQDVIDWHNQQKEDRLIKQQKAKRELMDSLNAFADKHGFDIKALEKKNRDKAAQIFHFVVNCPCSDFTVDDIEEILNRDE